MRYLKRGDRRDRF